MHELSIAQALIEQVEAAVDGNGDSRVLRVTVQVGTLSGADEAALAMAFPLAAEGTRAADAALDIETVTARVMCNGCNCDSSPQFPFFVCELCGSSDVDITAGRELLLKEIEIET